MADWPVTLSGTYAAGQLANGADLNTDLVKLRDAINQMHDRFGSFAINTTFYQKWPAGASMIKLGKDARGEMAWGPTILTGPASVGTAHTHNWGAGEGTGSIHNSVMQDPTGHETDEQPYLRMDDSDITPLKMFKVPTWMGGVRLRHFSVTNMSWLPFSTGVTLRANAHTNGATSTGVTGNLVYSCGAAITRHGADQYRFSSDSTSQTKNPPLFGVAYSTSLAAMNVQAESLGTSPSIAGTVKFLDTPWSGWPAKASTSADAANDDGQRDIMTYRWGEKTGTEAHYAPVEKTYDMSVALAPGNYVMIYCGGAIMARHIDDPDGSIAAAGSGGDTTHYGAVYLNRDGYLRFDCTLLCDAMPPIP
jgi:hypothetical protein